ncbi:heat shock protein 27-like [Episyrphus balteatus]|uniref:heat shock protein 27-like n=1 Tax=Episyrphus balteatus TaxID=286459 RepID=UPI0024868794|nr:heat shock protein 27-like [Episyrphus balteatus]
MSLIPLLADVVSEIDAYRGHRDLGDDFGFGIYPCDIYRPRIASLQLSPIRRFSPYQRSLQSVRGKGVNGKLNAKENYTVGKDGFQVCMDVSQFKPNELTVKTVGNNVVVEGKHEEREDDHGFISRQFVRKYTLPKGYDAKDVISTVSTDGVLTVKAPPPPKALKSNERIVQIQQTGPAHLSVKGNEEEGTEQVQNNHSGKTADKMEQS